MPGLNLYSSEYPYAAISLHGQLGHTWIFRTRANRQQCYPYVVPSNPRTPLQQLWRWTFAQAVLAWRALTPPFKMHYNTIAAARPGRSGINIFVAEYLSNYPLP